jgi:molybdate transport system substrate-binding protein
MNAVVIVLLCAAVLKPAITELAPEFERATGHTLNVTYESAGVVRDRILKSEAADVTIIQKPVVESLARQGAIVAGSVVTLARSGVAIGVPAGRPKPDIGSVDALKRALAAAPSIAYPDSGLGHASGIHFRGVMDRLGITREVDAKAKLMKGTVVEFAAHDSADIVVTQPMEILATPGYELVGWLPEELQDRERFTWSAGIPASAKSPDAGRALIQFLVSPAARAVITKKGMEPAR